MKAIPKPKNPNVRTWFNPPAELATKSGGRLFLSFTQVLGAGPDPKEPGEFKVSTREYSYRLLQRVDVASREILAYHWHPNDSALRDPHLHIRSSSTNSLSHFSYLRGRLHLYAHQVLRCTTKDEALRMDGHHGEKQESFRTDGYVEGSTSALSSSRQVLVYSRLSSNPCLAPVSRSVEREADDRNTC